MNCTAAQILDIIRCPKYHSELVGDAEQLVCSNAKCRPSNEPFFSIAGQPVLSDFDISIIDRCSFRARGGSSTKERDDSSNSIKQKYFLYYLTLIVPYRKFSAAL